MKGIKEAFIWAIALLAVGIFLLLKNLGAFGQWGDLAWGALFAAVGLGFLIWFVIDSQRWWRAIPAFTLLGGGGWIILQWRDVALGEWAAALVLFGMALGFWAVLLVRSEHWWAVIPAGVLTVLGVLLGFWSRLPDMGRQTVLVMGIGLVFAFLYLIRFGQKDTRWAAVPAAAMMMLGLVTLMQSLNLPRWAADWWPLLLAVAGLGIGVTALGLRGAKQPVVSGVTMPPDLDAAPIAPGAERAEVLPEAPLTIAPPDSAPVDIYTLIRQQPEPSPPPDVPSDTPAQERTVVAEVTGDTAADLVAEEEDDTER